MKLIFPVAALIACIGCASTQVNSRFSEHKRKIDEAHDRVLVPSDAPLVSAEFEKSDYQDKFAKEVCGHDGPLKGWKGPSRSKCNKKFDEHVQARLSERYPATDGQAIERKCKAYPIECKQPDTFERWVRESHNQRVEESRAAKTAELTAWRDNALAQIQAHDAAAWGDAGRNLSGLSQELSSQKQQQAPMTPIYQQCRSRPDGYGGIVTDCGP